MKKIFPVLLTVSALFIFAKSILAETIGIGTTGPIFPTPTVSAPTCTDTDDRNIYTKGSITTVINGVTSTLFDVCTPDGTKLSERYCASGVAKFSTYTCANGCVNGACVATAPTSTPTIKPTATPTIGSTVPFFPTTTPTIKPTATPTVSAPTCTDTDDRNIYTKGSITTIINGVTTTLYDVCTPDSKKLSERYCVSGTARLSTYTCAKGCVNGACLQ